MLAIYWHAQFFPTTAILFMTCVSLSHVSFFNAWFSPMGSDHPTVSRHTLDFFLMETFSDLKSYSNSDIYNNQIKIEVYGVRGELLIFKIL